MRIWSIIALALGGLRRTPLRAVLTCLGVTIAAGALVSMVAFALGLQAQAEAPFEQLGLLNNIEVSPKRQDAANQDAANEDVSAQDASNDDDPSQDAPTDDDSSQDGSHCREWRHALDGGFDRHFAHGNDPRGRAFSRQRGP